MERYPSPLAHLTMSRSMKGEATVKVTGTQGRALGTKSWRSTRVDGDRGWPPDDEGDVVRTKKPWGYARRPIQPCVECVDSSPSNEIVAVCRHARERQTNPILSSLRGAALDHASSNRMRDVRAVTVPAAAVRLRDGSDQSSASPNAPDR